MELRDFDWSEEFLKVGSCSFRLLRERSAPAPSQAQLMPTAHNTGPGALGIGSTGTFPGGLAADLARCPLFYYYYFIIIIILPSQCAKVIISYCGIP